MRLNKAFESSGMELDFLSLIPGLGALTATLEVLCIASNNDSKSKKIEELGMTTGETLIGAISGGMGLIMGILSIANGIEDIKANNNAVFNNTSDKVLKQVNVFVQSDSMSKQYFFTVPENSKLEGLQQKLYELHQGSLISLNREPELIIREIRKYAEGCEKNET